MLLPTDTKPMYSIYYIGGLLLKTIKQHSEHDFMNIYDIMNKNYHVSFKLYILAIDWLYLIDAIQIDQKGWIEYVS